MSLKSIYLDSHWNSIHWPDAKFTVWPSSHVVDKERRSMRIMNRQSRNQLYLTSVPNPAPKDQESDEMKQTESDVHLNQPYLQILKSLGDMETKLNQKIDNLRNVGPEAYLDQSMKEKLNSHHEDPNVTFPENQEQVSPSVKSVRDLKTKPRKKPRKEILPILAHEESHHKKRRKKL